MCLHRVILMFAFLFVCGGCQRTVTIVDSPATTKTATAPHEHKTGPHGGLVSGVGLDDKMHVELVIDRKNYELLFYILGEDEKTPLIIPGRLMEVMYRNPDTYYSSPVVPKVVPDKDNLHPSRFNLFVGNLYEQDFVITHVSFKLKIGNDRYTVRWDLMPEDVPVGEEADICLKPGGIYTLEDIKANGNTVPSIKYKGLVFPHEKPELGDKICPITGVKADDRCWWIIGGNKKYYCCPPCITLDVKKAKKS